MADCLFIRAEEWMRQVYDLSVRGCTYELTPFCRYWEECAVDLRIDWFASRKLVGLFQSRKEEIITRREAISYSEKMREETRRYTFRKRKK